jgi:predicted HAD superfamily Cof-like phosphohydrolase
MQTLIEIIGKVKEFHEVFGLGVNDRPSAGLDTRTVQLRHRLMQEENDEYLDAAGRGDLEEIADALGDKLYILCGTIVAHGLQDRMEAIFNEIHRSNMSKLGADGKPVRRRDGKILKGEGYFKPDIQSILKEKT